MITIALTKKLFELSALVEEQDNEEEAEFYKWHANVFRMARKNNINQLFVQSLIENLRADEFSDSKITEYVSKADAIKFTKTYSRSVLGSMTDMVKMTGFLISDYPPHAMNIIALNQKNNRCPLVKLSSFPERLMKEALGLH
ncbi:hypothetical protein A3842_23850 [Paenibacillus sp. P3E]|uniref:DUF6933 domain-containing protein n=1 Tax=Paenibacillus sp. P3E TaxID=1349435 RepID=UPI00093EC816|nr:hypothetical protein [Paenibacillus sp. P3E]OKP71514.1 hypothetical protein A3842_23850 [Paenibacillus sp. P3E]